MQREIKFRAFISEDINNYEDGTSKHIEFYLHNVAVYDESIIGISSDDFYKQTKNLDLPEEWLNRLRENFEDEFCHEDWLNITRFKALEEYTGLKDKNGKEIYDGDIVLHKCLETVFDEELCAKLIKDIELKYSGKFDNIDEWEDYIRKQSYVEKEISRRMPVCFDKGHFYMKREHNQWLYFGVGKQHSEEVIGNIHSNPELLEDK